MLKEGLFRLDDLGLVRIDWRERKVSNVQEEGQDGLTALRNILGGTVIHIKYLLAW